jgi:hypothetical protein
MVTLGSTTEPGNIVGSISYNATGKDQNGSVFATVINTNLVDLEFIAVSSFGGDCDKGMHDENAVFFQSDGTNTPKVRQIEIDWASQGDILGAEDPDTCEWRGQFLDPGVVQGLDLAADYAEIRLGDHVQRWGPSANLTIGDVSGHARICSTEQVHTAADDGVAIFTTGYPWSLHEAGCVTSATAATIQITHLGGPTVGDAFACATHASEATGDGTGDEIFDFTLTGSTMIPGSLLCTNGTAAEAYRDDTHGFLTGMSLAHGPLKNITDEDVGCATAQNCTGTLLAVPLATTYRMDPPTPTATAGALTVTDADGDGLWEGDLGAGNAFSGFTMGITTGGATLWSELNACNIGAE